MVSALPRRTNEHGRQRMLRSSIGGLKSAEMFQKVKLLLAQDQRQTCKELSGRADISAVRKHRILLRDLDKQKKFSKWVPKLLIEEQRNDPFGVSRNRGVSSFFERIVARDETWVYFWNPETNSQSVEWRSPGYLRPQKAIRKQTSLKIIDIMLFDVHEVLLN